MFHRVRLPQSCCQGLGWTERSWTEGSTESNGGLIYVPFGPDLPPWVIASSTLFWWSSNQWSSHESNTFLINFQPPTFFVSEGQRQLAADPALPRRRAAAAGTLGPGSERLRPTRLDAAGPSNQPSGCLESGFLPFALVGLVVGRPTIDAPRVECELAFQLWVLDASSREKAEFQLNISGAQLKPIILGR